MRHDSQPCRRNGHRACRMGEAASAPKAPPAVAPAAATPGQAADVWHPRAVIVHPRFVHTLGDLPVAAEPLPPTNWRCLPAELVEHIAGCLESERDVLNLAAVCRDARCAVVQAEW